jgi:hypothetical protein
MLFGRECCGKFVDIYIAPNSPGAATGALLQNVRDYINCRKMITTQISVEPSGISKVWIKATIYGKPLIAATDIYNQVVDGLDRVYGYLTLKINRDVSVPDIISTIKSFSTVDNVEIEQVKILPFARPINNTINPLNIDFITLPTTATPYKYTIQWNQGMNKFVVYRGTFLRGYYAVGDTYADDVLTFELTSGTYTNQDKWEFTAFASYPEIFPIANIDINDYSAPIVSVGPTTESPRTIFSELTIKTQASSTSCQPNC